MKRKGILTIGMIIYLSLAISSYVFLGILSFKDTEKEYLEENESLFYKTLEEKYNLKIDKTKYDVKARYISMGFKGYYRLEARKKDLKYKSKYFKYLEDRYSSVDAISDIVYFINFFNDTEFQQYILNELIYDKSKGNDFEKIEEIFSRYDVEVSSGFYSPPRIDCFSSSEVKPSFTRIYKVLDKECTRDSDSGGYSVFLEKYSNKVSNYFKIKRSFSEIDLYNYMKENKIYPTLVFQIDTSTEELGKIKEDITKYYNPEEIQIFIKINTLKQETRKWEEGTVKQIELKE